VTGNEVGVTVHNLATMAPAEIKAVLEKASTIFGKFCNSGAYDKWGRITFIGIL
jgi:hypothetical protein